MYPTKEQILAEKIYHKKSLIHNLIEWKKDCQWKTATKQEKIKALLFLLMLLEKEHKIKITKRPGQIYCFLPGERTIVIDAKNPSILSTLHEFAHSIDTNNKTTRQQELFACRWSVQLFQKAFPASFKNLSWEGHMLKKKI